MFIRQVSNSYHTLVAGRQFYDTESDFTPEETAVAEQFQIKVNEYQTYLELVYQAKRQGAKTDGIPKPAWLVAEVTQAASVGETPRKPDTEVPSSSKSRGRPKKSESSSSTSPKDS